MRGKLGGNPRWKIRLSVRTKRDGSVDRRERIGVTRKDNMHRLYARWNGMVQRCTNPNWINYHNYGGKGVTVCERWRTFANFRDDMDTTFEKGMWLERVKNELGYSPENCRWSTPKQQQNHRTNNTLITHKGETLTVSSWAERLGVKRGVIALRHWRGWSPEECLYGRPKYRAQNVS